VYSPKEREGMRREESREVRRCEEGPSARMPEGWNQGEEGGRGGVFVVSVVLVGEEEDEELKDVSSVSGKDGMMQGVAGEGSVKCW
jgi:hypothetical protein